MVQLKQNNGIHEGVIKDIVDLIGDGQLDDLIDSPFLKNWSRNNYFSSITKATSNLVLTFPVIVDESVSLSTASIISKAVEKKMVSLLQMLFSAINISNNKDAFDFIGKVHKNLTSDDIISFINKMDNIPLKENADGTADLNYEKINEIMLEHMRENNHYLRTELAAPIQERAKPRPTPRPKPVPKPGRDNKRHTEVVYDKDFIKDTIIPNDLKKANEAVPSLMIIKFRTGENNDTVGQAVIGVKAKLVYVSQSDMVNRIIMKNGDNNVIFSLLRATTGEISMIKDFMFAIDRAKLDTFGRKSSSTPLWKMLERRAIVSKSNRFFDSANGTGTSIATLLISKDTEDALLKEYNFKCKPYNLLNVMSEYSCLGFIIADDVTEKVRMLFDDNSGSFEVLSYSSLEREDKSQYKKLISLMVNR